MEDPELSRALEHPAGEQLVLLPLLDVGADLLLDEVPHALAEHLVRLGEMRRGHRCSLTE
jgi:hypothetical protein